jgi:NSS family neurotransmitter:Na+ symporter
VQGGLEKAVRLLMPSLFVLLILLVAYAMTTGAYMQGLEFLFKPDFSKMTGDGVLTAMGHAFFTLSLGMGAIMVYGSYLPKGISIAKTSILIAGADTLVALLAGVAIFPDIVATIKTVCQKICCPGLACKSLKRLLICAALSPEKLPVNALTT